MEIYLYEVQKNSKMNVHIASYAVKYVFFPFFYLLNLSQPVLSRQAKLILSSLSPYLCQIRSIPLTHSFSHLNVYPHPFCEQIDLLVYCLKTKYCVCSSCFLPNLVYSTILSLLLSLFHFRGRTQLLSGSHLLSAM